jgi:dTMP kinase
MFITFEGPEGAGKSTAVREVAGRLRARGLTVLTTREPGAGTFGAAVREVLLHGEAMPPAAELFLFLADRANHVARIVRPALARGEWVLCDRFADSTLVYQSHVRGLDLAFVRSANAFATGGLVPDLTLLLDLDPELGLARVSSANRLDREPLEFHRAVRAGFLALAEAEPLRWRIIDAAASPTEVTDRIEHALPMR